MVLATGLALALIPQETSDSFGGFRIFGIVVYAATATAIGHRWLMTGRGI